MSVSTEHQSPYIRGAYHEGRFAEIAALLGYAIDDTASGALPADEQSAGERESHTATKTTLVVAVEMAGPKSCVDAIRRDLKRGDSVGLSRGASWTQSARLHRPSQYRVYQTTLPNGYAHVLLLHARAALDGLVPEATAYLVDPVPHDSAAVPSPPTDRMLRHFHHMLNGLIPLPLFPEWAQPLWDAGQAAGLVEPLRDVFALSAWRLRGAVAAWHDLVRTGLHRGQLVIGADEVSV